MTGAGAHRAPLPDDPDRPVIVVATGCGIAPFPGFRACREAGGHRRPMWLIFGTQKRVANRFHGERLHAWQRDGTLDRLDPAFSLDPGGRGFVKDRMAAWGAGTPDWIDRRGAVLSVPAAAGPPWAKGPRLPCPRSLRMRPATRVRPQRNGSAPVTARGGCASTSLTDRPAGHSAACRRTSSMPCTAFWMPGTRLAISIGKGKMMVEFFSPAMKFSVER
jgi:hypothetical protein